MFDWIVNVVRALGYPGVALLTFLENVVPPIPSEFVMPLTGFIAARDGFTVWGAIAAGTGGSLAGAVGSNVIGRRVGEERVHYLSPATWVVIGGIVAWHRYKVITYDSAADGERTA